MDRPVCKCHAEPMVKNGRHRSGNQAWACAERYRLKAARTYDQLTGVAYNRRLLQMRRACAMKRRRQKRAAHG